MLCRVGYPAAQRCLGRAVQKMLRQARCGADTHKWGPWHPHPLPAPARHSTSGLVAVMPHLNLASIQGPEPVVPPPRLGAGVSGAGLTSAATIFHLPTSEAKRNLLRKQTVVLFPHSLCFSQPQRRSPLPHPVSVRSIRLGGFASPLRHHGSLPQAPRGSAGIRMGKLSSEHRAGQQE